MLFVSSISCCLSYLNKSSSVIGSGLVVIEFVGSSCTICYLSNAYVAFVKIRKQNFRFTKSFMIFILTFSLISVSGFREDEILDLAHKRLSIDSDNGRSQLRPYLYLYLPCLGWTRPSLSSCLQF